MRLCPKASFQIKNVVTKEVDRRLYVEIITKRKVGFFNTLPYSSPRDLKYINAI